MMVFLKFVNDKLSYHYKGPTKTKKGKPYLNLAFTSFEQMD